MQTRVRMLVPSVLVAVLAGCGSGTVAPAAAPAVAGYQQPPAQGSAEDAAQGEEEEPLTGELKRRAEQAALAAFPGTVVKSEYDAERPGLYGVEIRQANGETVEVYLDQSFNVAGTKDEGQEDGDEEGQGH
jgi:hypothetical protein